MKSIYSKSYPTDGIKPDLHKQINLIILNYVASKIQLYIFHIYISYKNILSKLREKLGLAPLADTNEPNSEDSDADDDSEDYVDRDDTHVPASNLSAAKTNERLKEKIELSKNKRLLNEKLE